MGTRSVVVARAVRFGTRSLTDVRFMACTSVQSRECPPLGGCAAAYLGAVLVVGPWRLVPAENIDRRKHVWGFQRTRNSIGWGTGLKADSRGKAQRTRASPPVVQERAPIAVAAFAHRKVPALGALVRNRAWPPTVAAVTTTHITTHVATHIATHIAMHASVVASVVARVMARVVPVEVTVRGRAVGSVPLSRGRLR